MRGQITDHPTQSGTGDDSIPALLNTSSEMFADTFGQGMRCLIRFGPEPNDRTSMAQTWRAILCIQNLQTRHQTAQG